MGWRIVLQATEIRVLTRLTVSQTAVKSLSWELSRQDLGGLKTIAKIGRSFLSVAR
jgi:hypothetical protein